MLCNVTHLQKTSITQSHHLEKYNLGGVEMQSRSISCRPT